jgi:hypothetical protein
MQKAVFMTPGTREYVAERGGVLAIARHAIMMG